MADIGQYIDMMIASLHKKILILDRIIAANEELEKLSLQPELELDDLTDIMDEKDVCIREMNQMDEGFQTVYDRLKTDLKENRLQYQGQIRSMQQMIREITDKTMLIQEQEAKNRLAIEGQFARMHKNVRSTKRGMDVAQNYYRSMSGMNVVESQFLDKKK